MSGAASVSSPAPRASGGSHRLAGSNDAPIGPEHAFTGPDDAPTGPDDAPTGPDRAVAGRVGAVPGPGRNPDSAPQPSPASPFPFRRILARVPIWIAVGGILNLVIVVLAPGDSGIGALADLALGPAVLGVVLALLPWVTQSLRVCTWTRAFGRPLRFSDGLRIAFAGDISAAVTPTALGGAPAKAALLYREGFAPGTAVLLTGLGTLEDGIFFTISVPLAIWLSPALGFADLVRILTGAGEQIARRVGQLVADLGAAFGSIAGLEDSGHGQTAERITGALGAVATLLLVLGLGLAVRWLDRRYGRRVRAQLAETWMQMRAAFALFRRERRRLLLTLPLTALHWSARYAVVSCVAWGFGLSVDPLLFYVLQCVVFTVMTFVPSPGAVGGAEGAFLLFHQGLIGAQLPVLLLAWRALTFLLPVSLAAVLLFLLERGRSRSDAEMA